MCVLEAFSGKYCLKMLEWMDLKERITGRKLRLALRKWLR